MQLDMKALAKRGAEIRIGELTQELTAIRKTFRINVAAIPSDTPRHRKPMTAAQKREVSRRMKKYWAERRKGK